MRDLQTTPIGITAIWKAGYRLFCERFRQLIWFPILIQAINTLCIFYAVKNNVTPDYFKAHPGIVVACIFAEIILVIIIRSIVLHNMGTHMQETPTSLMQSLLIALKKFPALLILYIIAMILLVAGTLALVLPGLFLMVAFAFLFPYVVIDNEDIFSAIAKSCRIVWGNWWRTIGAYVVPVILVTVVIGLLSMAVSKIIHLFLPPKLLWVFFDQAFNCILQGCVLLFAYAVLLIQWQDLKIRYQVKTSNSHIAK